MTGEFAQDLEELDALSRDDVRRLEVAAMFAELNPIGALEDACLEHHRYNVAQQRERNLFARNGREATRPGRSETRYATFDGDTRTVREWAELRGIQYSTVKERMARGASPEEALSRPVRKYDKNQETRLLTIDGETRAFGAWCRVRGIHPQTARKRLELGWTPMEVISTPVDERYSPIRHRRQSRPDDDVGKLIVLRDKEGEPMQTREEHPAPATPSHALSPALVSTPPASDPMTDAFVRARQRAKVRAEAQAVLAVLSLDDQRAVLADLLVGMEASP